MSADLEPPGSSTEALLREPRALAGCLEQLPATAAVDHHRPAVGRYAAAAGHDQSEDVPPSLGHADASLGQPVLERQITDKHREAQRVPDLRVPSDRHVEEEDTERRRAAERKKAAQQRNDRRPLVRCDDKGDHDLAVRQLPGIGAVGSSFVVSGRADRQDRPAAGRRTGWSASVGSSAAPDAYATEWRDTTCSVR